MKKDEAQNMEVAAEMKTTIERSRSTYEAKILEAIQVHKRDSWSMVVDLDWRGVTAHAAPRPAITARQRKTIENAPLAIKASGAE